jgi:diguanylate cyclase (GGDEF)-like protein
VLKAVSLPCRSKLVPLSFRHRLTLFFVLIVVLPMIAVAALVINVTGESSSGKADARLAAGLETALSVYERDVGEARTAVDGIEDDPDLAPALASRDQARVEAVAERLRRERDLVALRISDEGGGELGEVGDPAAIAAAELELNSPGGAPLGMIEASTTTSKSYLTEVEDLTGEDVALVSGSGAQLAGTAAVDGVELPASGDSADLDVEGDEMRVAAAEVPGANGVRVALVAPVESGGFFSSSPGVVAALAAFFGVALIFVLMLSRTLQAQVSEMLGAARRIGEGDFSREVPVVGRDEMAGLASEFNKMSGRLIEQMDELRSQRAEIERSVRRIGEAFASGLDRQALLEVVVEATVSACSADYGLIALSGHVGAEAEAGNASEAMQEAALEAEEQALRDSDVVDAQRDGAHAISSPLTRLGGPDALGAMTIARDTGPFTTDEHDVFRYLVGQASASVENVALHEVVSEQAVTDDLTGLANNRAFRDVAEKEAARAERFGHDLSLLMLDIDDFKQVNDTRGHLQGDAVLRAIARILVAESRGVDEPARYGGEEFVVALPETDGHGALELAERIRVRIEAERVPLVDGNGQISVTASLGAATLPHGARDVPELIAAADAALYEAKRAGKNQVRSAGRGRSEGGTPAPVDSSGAKGPAPARRR